jgi:hypothetical protein
MVAAMRLAKKDFVEEKSRHAMQVGKHEAKSDAGSVPQ